ncbi:MAG: SpvB/TcaC N-terminal domain-containing protein [Pseudomonadales bacterium]|nr:SpvB/TcaC N-terminal domain-containing protein [Pseudomonadales bacterium]
MTQHQKPTFLFCCLFAFLSLVSSFTARADVLDILTPLFAIFAQQAADNGVITASPAITANGNYELSWYDDEGLSYLQERAADGTWASLTTATGGAGYIYHDVTGKAQGAYQYRLRYTCTSNCPTVTDDEYDIVVVVTAEAVVETFTADQVIGNPSQYTLNWTALGDAITLEVREDDGGWLIAQDNVAAGEQSYTVNLASAVSYSYRLTACLAGECVNRQVAISDGVPESQPLIITPDVSIDGNYGLSWGYVFLRVLQQQDTSGQWVNLPYVSEFPYPVTGKAPGTYQYRFNYCILFTEDCSPGPIYTATVIDASDSSANPVSGKLTSESTSDDGNYALNWVSQPGINYLLQEQTYAGDWRTLHQGYTATRLEQSYNVTNRKYNGDHHYRLMACGYPAVLEGVIPNCVESSAVTVIVDLANVVSVPVGGIQAPALSNSDSYTLQWSVSATANVTYRVEERIGTDGLWHVVQDSSTLSYDVSGKTEGTYYYRLRVCDADGFCSVTSPITSVVMESQDESVGNYSAVNSFELSIVADSYQPANYMVSWTIPDFGPGITSDGFELQEKIGSGEWQSLPTSSTATSYAGNDKPSGIYSYRISHCDWITIPEMFGNPSTTVRYCAVDNEASIQVDRDVRAPVASQRVGTTTGQFRVNEQGSAGYSIAIADLPGRGGVTPNLSVNYSSGGANGPLGVGWSIGGLSSISRCRQTAETDQRDRAVMLDSEDRFCLDGARLVKVDGQENYGEVGSEYRTEIDQSLRVISYNSAVTGKLYFKVWRKDGSVSQYGNSDDSAVVSVDSTVVETWGRNRFTDSAGNYMTYEYLDDPKNGGFNIDSVRYTGSSTGANDPSSYIKFQYDSSRFDTVTQYALGSKHSMERRLKSIEVREGDITDGNTADDPLYRRYDFHYSASLSSQRSVLRSIQECVSESDSDSDSDCLPATRFDWHEPDRSLNGDASSGTFTDNYLGGRPIDVNGDGKQDWLWIAHNGSYQFRLSYSDGTSLVESSFEVSAPNIAREAWHVIDYNNDGYQDLIYATNDGWKVHLSDGANLSEQSIDTGVPSSNSSKAIFSDLNGDGLVDILNSSDAGVLTVHYLKKVASWNAVEPYHFDDAKTISIDPNSTEFVLDFNNMVQITGTDLKDHPPMDLNGDGRVDFLLRTTISRFTNAYTWQVTGYGWALLTVDPDLDSSAYPTKLKYVSNDAEDVISLLPENKNDFRLIDINGDGLTDIFKKEGSTWKYQLNNGNPPQGLGSSFETAISVGEISSPEKIQFADVNGDRVPDLVHVHTFDGVAQFAVRLWLGTGYGTVQPLFQNASYTLGASSGITPAFLDADGDGYSDYLSVNTASNSYYLAFNHFDRTPQDLIHRITNGFGAKTEITYTTLTNDQDLIYTRGHGASALNWGNGSPVFDLNSPMHVVSRVSSSAPVEGDPGNMAELEYFYQGLRIQAGGRGSLGFEYLTTYDPQSGVLVDTQYRQDYPFTGMPLQTIKYHLDTSTLLSVAQNEWQQNSTSSGTVYPYLSESTETSYDPLSGALLSSVTTTNEYRAGADVDYANLGTVTVEIRDATGTLASRKTTGNIYENTVNLEQWHLGRLTETTVTHERPGKPTTTRTAQFGYNPSTGILDREIIEPNGAANEKLTTVYAPDDYGQRVGTNQCSSNAVCSSPGFDENDPNFISRQSRVEMDSTHRFVERTFNSQNHLLKSVTQRDTFGRATEVDLINGNHLETVYDDWGRPRSTTATPGITTTYEYQLCTNTTEACPSGAVYLSLQTTNTGQKAVQYFDVLGREMRKSALGFGGQTIQTDTHYDTVGRVVKVSSPYFAGDTVNWTQTGYDNYGRVKLVTLPDGSSSTISYDGLQTTTTANGVETPTSEALNQTQIEITNVLGETIKIIDAMQGVLTNTYDAQGNLLTVEGVDGEVITMEYDRLGRKILMVDPDKGTWSYQYNALGELVSQTDAKGQTTTQRYDALGRMIKRTSASEDIRWTYDTAPNGVGKLHSVINHHDGYQNTISYDSNGRVKSTLIQITGIPPYTSQIGYDAYGRVNTQTGVDGREIKTEYDDFGYAASTVDVASDTTLSKIIEMDARGQVIERQSGNGLTTTNQYDPKTSRLISTVTGNNIQNLLFKYDGLGNLKERTDNSGSKQLFESFEYDDLNRLEDISTYDSNDSSSLMHQTTVDYHANGNIAYKSDVGTYQYGANGAGPHAVTSAGGDSGFTYDANGNQTSGKGRTLQYSSFDKLTSVTQNGHATTFNYGTGHSRYKRVDTDSSNNVTTTYYLGGIELIKKNNQFVEYRNNLGGVQITTDYNDSSNSETRYLYKDHLGSLDVITDANGALQESYSFDAWGKRRAINSWNPLSAADIQTHYINTDHTTNRGYTGHEQMYEVGLIHMNRRIYDPMLGRVLQADPVIDGVGSTQGYNRYSYVHNNPLAYTDPSGFSRWTKFRDKWLKPIAVIAISYVTYGAASGAVYTAYGVSASAAVIPMKVMIAAGVAGGAAAGFAAGVSMAAFSGAGFGDAMSAGVKGAFSGAVFGGIAGAYGKSWDMWRVGANSLAGGVTSKFNGGEFKEGFRFSLAVSVLTYSAITMREKALSWARNNPNFKDSAGSSNGFNGDGQRTGGVFPKSAKGYTGSHGETFNIGGRAFSQERHIFGIPYPKGGTADYLVEAFGGPHDFLDGPLYDIPNGLVRDLGIYEPLGFVYSGFTIPLAAPFAVASMVEPYQYFNSLDFDD